MKTTNWQAKALTLFIAAAALWLTTACTSAGPTNVAPPTQAATETPTQESAQTPAVTETPAPQAGCTHETPELRSWLNTTEEEYVANLPGAWLSSSLVRDKYEDLFWRQPNVYDVSIGQLRTGEGRWTKTWAITVWVTEKVDPTTLPPEDRVPEFLDDVHIRILETEQGSEVPESNCSYSMCGVKLEEGEESMTNPDANQQEGQTATEISTTEMIKVRNKYEPLFMSQPNVYSTSVGYFTDANGEEIDTWGIIVSVTKRVDQSTLPPEDRIPDCLENVPVQIREEQPYFITQGSIQKGDR